MLAIIRPDEWELPLFLHVAGAMAFVGTLVLTLVLVGANVPSRTTYRTLLWGVLPAFVVMRGTAQWIADKEDVLDDPPSWVDIGFMTTDPAVLLLIASLVITGVAARRGNATPRWVTALTGIMLVLSLVAVWAMTTKPT